MGASGMQIIESGLAKLQSDHDYELAQLRAERDKLRDALKSAEDYLSLGMWGEKQWRLHNLCKAISGVRKALEETTWTITRKK